MMHSNNILTQTSEAVYFEEFMNDLSNQFKRRKCQKSCNCSCEDEKISFFGHRDIQRKKNLNLNLDRENLQIFLPSRSYLIGF